MRRGTRHREHHTESVVSGASTATAAKARRSDGQQFKRARAQQGKTRGMVRGDGLPAGVRRRGRTRCGDAERAGVAVAVRFGLALKSFGGVVSFIRPCGRQRGELGMDPRRECRPRFVRNRGVGKPKSEKKRESERHRGTSNRKFQRGADARQCAAERVARPPV